jgi:large subunit ribosomal protein L6
MSRIGKKVIPLPTGVKVVVEAQLVKVTGPKGNLNQLIDRNVTLAVEGDKLIVHAPEAAKNGKALHGLTRTLVANMVKGVSQGFERVLEINGVGYRAEVKGDALNFSLGYSHPIRFPLPEGIRAEVERQVRITLKGSDRNLLGMTAAKIRRLRPPEPYGGKGIKYAEEVIHRKAGKTAAA